MTDDQTETIAFLQGAGGGPVPDDMIETHGAIVALYRDEALKIKRAVKYDYLDFSTLELREKMLRREVTLNGAAAPGLYRDVVPITRDARGKLQIGGQGAVVEWVLRMVRFPAEAELSVMADNGQIDLPLADALGRSIADYHQNAQPVPEDGAVLIAEIIAELDRVLSDMAGALGQDSIDAVLSGLRAAQDRGAPLMRQRGQAGWVRRCHGDLHLRNIVMWKGQPTPFDALEFDERLGTCDVLYDLAFLLMDLGHRGLDDAANVTLNAYLFRADTDDHLHGLALLPLYLAVRAAIRAMVDVQTAPFQDDGQALIKGAAGFMAQACGYLQPQPPVLVALGGLSGTGKTTLAKQIAAQIGRRPGAVHIRSDLERKALFGVDPLHRLPQSAYDPPVTEKVYRRMREKARHALAAGHAVILDSVHGTLDERQDAGRIASDLGCAFHGIWLDLDTAGRGARVAQRKRDASDADAAVARRQAAMKLGPIDWTRIKAAGDLATLAAQALSVLKTDKDQA